MKRLVMYETRISLKVLILWAQVNQTPENGLNSIRVCVGVQFTVFTVHLFS